MRYPMAGCEGGGEGGGGVKYSPFAQISPIAIQISHHSFTRSHGIIPKCAISFENKLACSAIASNAIMPQRRRSQVPASTFARCPTFSSSMSAAANCW